MRERRRRAARGNVGRPSTDPPAPATERAGSAGRSDQRLGFAPHLEWATRPGESVRFNSELTGDPWVFETVRAIPTSAPRASSDEIYDFRGTDHGRLCARTLKFPREVVLNLFDA